MSSEYKATDNSPPPGATLEKSLEAPFFILNKKKGRSDFCAVYTFYKTRSAQPFKIPCPCDHRQ
jgi:hypothetical protein